MATPKYLLQSVKAAFAKAWIELQRMSGTDRGLLNIALAAPSNGKEEDYGWMGAMPAVSEFLSEAHLEQLTEDGFTLRNKDWHAPVQIRKSDFEDDKTGQAAMIGQMLAQQLAKHPARLIIDLIIAADSNLAYDGVAFISNASGVRVNDNLLTGTGTTLAQLATDLESVETAMAGFVDDKGEYLNIIPDTIVCGTSLYRKFQRLFGSDSDPGASVGGVFNPFKGQYSVYYDAKLNADDANDWYACATKGVLKPFVWQSRRNPKVEIEDRPTLPTYGIVATSRGNVGYGLPQLMVKTTNT